MKPDRVIFVLVLCLGAGVCQTPTPPSTKTARPDSSSPKNPNSKPTQVPAPKWNEKQKQAFNLLAAVESDLSRFSPETQTYLLQEMAKAYAKTDHRKQVALLQEAFQSAANMPEGDYRTEQQTEIVRALNQADPSALLSMQDSPDPKVREVVLQMLVKQDLDRGKLGVAAQRLSQWDPSLAFPYDDGKQVINRLTAQQTGERQSVFASAIASYRNGEVRTRHQMDVTEFILGTYEDVPAPMAVDAVDVVLNKVAKWEQETQEHTAITIAGKGGSAQFSSLYDLELFELLPVLDKLDSAKAEALRREHATVAALNAKYPKGKSSMSPDGEGFGITVASSDSGDPVPGPDEELLQQRQTALNIMESSAKDVDGAIARAQALPNNLRESSDGTTLRCGILESIARSALGRKDYTGALTAVKALVAAAQDLSPLARAHYLVVAAAVSAEAHEPQTAKQYLARSMKAADEAYQADAFGDPPNEAPKCEWPSTAAWKGTLVVAQRVDSGYAAQEADSLPDPEIEAVVNVARAVVLLDQEPTMTVIARQVKGEPGFATTFTTPWWSVPSSSGEHESTNVQASR